MRSGVASWPTELRREHGRVLGYAHHLLGSAFRAAGAWAALERVDFARVLQLRFACDGNICRSPYAAARARSLGLQASSFGLRASAGDPADPRAQQAARARGLELSGHAATRAPGRLGPGDLVLAMQPSQLPALRRLSSASGAQLSLLGLWAPEPRPHLQDPYGLGFEYFQTCFAIIDAAIERLARELESAR